MHLAVAALHVGDHRVGLGLRQLPGEPLAIRRPEHVQVAVMIAAQSQPTLAVRLPLLQAFHLVTYAGVDTAPTRSQRLPAGHYAVPSSIVLQHRLAI